MKKKVLIPVLGILVLNLFLLSIVSASSVEDEIQKITHYAEEYETGNIDYVQLLVHLGSTREKLNEVLGATEKFLGI